MSQVFILDSSLALSWCFENELTWATQEYLASLATEDAPAQKAGVKCWSEKI